MLEVEVAMASAVYLLSLYNYVRVLRKNNADALRNNNNTINNNIRILKNNKIQKMKRRRTLWMIHSNRTLSSMEDIFKKMTCAESGEFINFCRMSPTDFEFLLNKIEPMIKKKTRLRVPIPPKIRLAITLRYLATGDSYRSLYDLFKVSAPAISLIVPEVCKAINVVLRDQMRLPQTPEEWLVIEEGFRHKFPRCVGAIGGKHIVVKSQAHSGSEYNSKGICNIILMALVDSDYRFIYADISEKGDKNDKGIFQNSSMWQKIVDEALNLPPDTPLPGRQIDVPFVFLSDEALPLHKHIMKPFSGDHKIGLVENIFNYKLNSARVTFENVFGALTSVYRVFKKPVEISLENVPLITTTCILLHNFLRNSKFSQNIYTPPGTFDSIVDGKYVEGTWRKNHNALSAIRSITHEESRALYDVSEIRYEFGNYFHNLN